MSIRDPAPPILFLAVVAASPSASPSGPAARPRAPPTTTPAAARSPASRTAWPSPATTCPPPRSSASPAPSPCPGTTASSTRSASWSPGWSPCCWSPSCCATPAATRWPTSSPTGCGSARCAPPPPPRPSWSRSSTCWPRWSAPARWSPCCSASTSESAQEPSTIVGVGLLMIFYVTVGGMKGTTWVQIVKAVLLMGGTVLITVLVLAKFGFNLSDLLGAAAEQHRQGRGVPRARPEVRRHARPARSTSSASASRWCSAPPGCRTS